ncbi:hypothetical protein IC620_11520 [Hazenella sp. IB182357]|uniref:Uncharacterized protein n=1 Tax=Polycladospora coralii TaxID=2771432 RepID=A0A926NB87_9BACL|nr:hypothetical protein [Polycladospora coralii]MBD1372987.1 hypothetical protein [Polycladospora coralii]MBS7530954.1 hypothetical protein [Polycladospora coralii]
MEYLMVFVLVTISILSVMGTLYNKRTGNTAGFILGGALTLSVGIVAVLALYDAIIGISA